MRRQRHETPQLRGGRGRRWIRVVSLRSPGRYAGRPGWERSADGYARRRAVRGVGSAPVHAQGDYRRAQRTACAVGDLVRIGFARVTLDEQSAAEESVVQG